MKLKMPTPRKDESKDGFLGRCVPYVMDEGYDQDAAVARCIGIWNSNKKSFDPKRVQVSNSKSEVENG